MSPIYLFSQTLLVLVAALALWRGRHWERLTAGVLLANWLGTELSPDFNLVDPPWISMTLDGLVALYLVYAALFSGRKWTLWAAAFQLLLMANHLAFARYHLLDHWPYITAYYIWGDLGLLALAVGTVTRKHGVNTPASPQDEKDARR